MTTKTIKKETTRSTAVKQKIVTPAKSSKINAIIMLIIVTLIFSYISFDYFVLKHKIENKVLIVNQKFDSLEVYLNNKIPQIDQALKIQEEQVRNLQEMSTIYSKK